MLKKSRVQKGFLENTFVWTSEYSRQITYVAFLHLLTSKCTYIYNCFQIPHFKWKNLHAVLGILQDRQLKLYYSQIRQLITMKSRQLTQSTIHKTAKLAKLQRQ